jgi:hypothetical protein
VAIHVGRRQASEKRQGTKSRLAGCGKILSKEIRMIIKPDVRQSTPGQPIEGQIRRAFERAMAGKTPQEIADELNAEQDTHDEWRDLNDEQ